MILREAFLPRGWYDTGTFRPGGKGAMEEFLEPFAAARPSRAESSLAVIAPHAGWYYSGRLAALAFSALDTEIETVAVLGGHLGRGSDALFAPEDGVTTALGTMEIDRELREEFLRQFPARPDLYRDNTVEVLLPMARYFFPRAKLLWLRFPAELSSHEAGKILAEAAASSGRRTGVVASTDLTHYGANYGFSPRGTGKAALEWTKKNDAAFISAVLEGNPARVLERAEEDFSACSAGAVLGGLGFAAEAGGAPGGMPGGAPPRKSRLLAYGTSADTVQESGGGVPGSFVGYAAVSLC